MDKNGLLIVLLLLFMTVLGRSNALSSRKLVSTPDPNGSSNAIKDDPSSTSINDKKLNPSPTETTKPVDSPNTNPSNVDSKGLNDDKTKINSENPPDKTVEKEKGKDGKEKAETQTQMETFATKSCNGNPVCTDQGKTMIACIQDFENAGSNNVTLIVENEGILDLKVNITSDTSINDILAPFEIPGHTTKKVNFILSGDKTTKLILNGDCELQLKTTTINTPPKPKDPKTPQKPKDENDPANTPLNPKEDNNPPKPNNAPTNPKEIKEPPIPIPDTPATSPKDINTTPATSSKDIDTPATSPKDIPPPESVDVPISQNNLLDQLTFYSKQVTPMHGAYVAFLLALVVGGSWALCSFRKRRNDGGIPYQELEMGLPESSNAVNVDTVEGWDQDWDDDDWDEDKAIRSPGGGVTPKTISSNGLTSRKKDGWDADWDD
ncbi:uncharacterized protein LOC111898209 isoform X1 [Lactuca sativa]|uniref:uncharacterized protein LOC111898209 isoform X1 n=1 Tax=Lactuca sativa TaxID=4236 RepID=UPI000CD9D287|nr:uncharacterized protein LOC111898209 isoform X1 [Lactuca sativa]